MREIEIAGRIVLGIALFMALRLGLKMLFRKEEVAVEVKEGMTRYRWVFRAIVGLLALWYIVDPASRPVLIIVPLPAWVMLTGLLLTAVSLTLRVWAQFTLGKMWSERIRVLADHVVVRTGPYRYTAHPIYLSYIPLSVGLWLLTGDWLIGAAGLGYALLSWHRVPDEENILALAPTWYTVRLEPAAVVVLLMLLSQVPGMIYEFAWLIGAVR